MSMRIVCAALVFATACVAPAPAQNLTAGGATFPFPVYSKWFDDYHKKFPKISISDLFLEISELSGGNCELLRKKRPLLKRRFGLIMPHSVSFPTNVIILQIGLHFDSERR